MEWSWSKTNCRWSTPVKGPVISLIEMPRSKVQLNFNGKSCEMNQFDLNLHSKVYTLTNCKHTKHAHTHFSSFLHSFYRMIHSLVTKL